MLHEKTVTRPCDVDFNRHAGLRGVQARPTLSGCRRRHASRLDLSRFDSGSLTRLLVIKENFMASLHTDDFRREAVRIALTSGLTRRQIASDLGIGRAAGPAGV